MSDRHFVKLVRRNRSNIVYLIVGHEHVLTDDIAAGGDNMSHLVITPKSINETKQVKR